MQERRSLAGEGLDIQRLTGADIQPRHWDAFYQFYMNTTGEAHGACRRLYRSKRSPSSCRATLFVTHLIAPTLWPRMATACASFNRRKWCCAELEETV